MFNRAEVIDKNFKEFVKKGKLPSPRLSLKLSQTNVKPSDLISLFESQVVSRHMDLKARSLKEEGKTLCEDGKFKEGEDDSAKMNEVRTKIEESAENEKTENVKQNLDQEEQAKQQFLEQWLRKIPDDPGRLLRNKMELEFQRRGKQRQQNEQYW